MKVKELIEELSKQPQDAEVVLWEWTSDGVRVKYLTFGCGHNLVPNRKFYTILTNELMQPISQEKWHAMIKED